jgi:uncharacterized membrane protein (Fun14 family)
VDERLADHLQLREVLYGIFVITIFLLLRRGVVTTVTESFNRLLASRRGKPAVQPSGE